MKSRVRRYLYVLLWTLLSFFLFSSCITIKEFFKGFSSGEFSYSEGDFYDDGYYYGDDSGRDESQD